MDKEKAEIFFFIIICLFIYLFINTKDRFLGCPVLRAG